MNHFQIRSDISKLYQYTTSFSDQLLKIVSLMGKLWVLERAIIIRNSWARDPESEQRNVPDNRIRICWAF